MFRSMPKEGLENQLAEAGDTNTAESNNTGRRMRVFIMDSINGGWSAFAPEQLAV
jgi:hypothetical protein